MTAVRVSPSWLAVREPADAAARAGSLIDELIGGLPADRPLVVHDFACGTGSMLRWLAPQLPGPQHWVCYDIDADLLAIASRDGERLDAGGSAITLDIRQRDVTRLALGECADADLITTSALLDLLTADEVDRIVETCVAARCPALLTLSVTGRVELWPPRPLDAVVGTAFNAHQQRSIGGRCLLGPQAPDAVVRAFRRAGYEVLLRPSPWRLGAEMREVTAAWLTGWVAAACEQQPALTAQIRDYARERLSDAMAGRLQALVYHCDLLARPADRARGAG